VYIITGSLRFGRLFLAAGDALWVDPGEHQDVEQIIGRLVDLGALVLGEDRDLSGSTELSTSRPAESRAMGGQQTRKPCSKSPQAAKASI
jgi:hypothetical protein